MHVYIVLYIVYKTPIAHVPVSISQKMLYSGDFDFSPVSRHLLNSSDFVSHVSRHAWKRLEGFTV